MGNNKNSDILISMCIIALFVKKDIFDFFSFIIGIFSLALQEFSISRIRYLPVYPYFIQYLFLLEKKSSYMSEVSFKYIQ